MPRITEVPKALKPYLFHGVHLDQTSGKEEVSGDCPFCGKEGKFYVSAVTGLWQCKVCQAGNEKGGGNARVFLRLLWEESDKATNDYDGLAKERKLIYPETLIHWGACQSLLTGEWLLPGYNAERSLCQLYRYAYNRLDGRYHLQVTASLSQQLFIPDDYNKERETVWLCEGPWDGMALWEVLGIARRDEESGRLSTVSSPERSIRWQGNVIAVPSATTFNETWYTFFAGKRVVLLFDNDHPQKHPISGQLLRPVGYHGMERVTKILLGSPTPPASIEYLNWGPEGYDPELPHGYDVRDLLAEAGDDRPKRISMLSKLLGKIAPIPEEWKKGVITKSASTQIDCLDCTKWSDLVAQWHRALRWTDGLDRALSVMLACVTSTKAVGDQLWCKIIGPPASGKSTLCEALSVNRKYIYPKDTVTGLLSGYQSDRDGTQNYSLADSLRNKTLVIKDGDTLRSDPAREKILSQFRAFFDRAIRSQYGNKMSANHEGVNATVIICGTNSLRFIDASDLGERFVDYVLMDKVEDELEDEILWNVANRAERDLSYESDGKLETQYDPDIVRAMQLTGGYINYLRENAFSLLGSLAIPDDKKRYCIALGQFVAYMRARPSRQHDEAAEKEFATRLVSQMIRLTKCLAVVLNRKTIDEVVLERIRAVALDTARGNTLDLVKCIHTEGKSTTKALAGWVHSTERRTYNFLSFLRRIGAVDLVEHKENGVKQPPRWILQTKVHKLCKRILG